jgi:prepilin-type N-terminal cleavage/methylation domain-containing protein
LEVKGDILYLINMKTRLSHAFSLVELLIVVAVIGIIASIAIPTFESIVNQSRIKADAHIIAQTSQNAVLAGIRWKGEDLAALVEEVVKGQTASEGDFKGKEFKVALPDDRVAAALSCLKMMQTPIGRFVALNPSNH